MIGRVTEEILHKRGEPPGKKYFKEGSSKKGLNQILWVGKGAVIFDETMPCPILLGFFTSFILSRSLDVYYFWKELCTMAVSSKAIILPVISKKRDKITFL